MQMRLARLLRHVPEPRRDADPSEGFTLIEMIIAIAILTILAFSTVLVLVPVAREHRSARESDSANAAVRDVLEGMHATPFLEITTRYPEGIQIPIPDLPGGLITIDYQNANSDPLVIQVDLQYDTPDSGQISRTFFTVRTE